MVRCATAPASRRPGDWPEVHITPAADDLLTHLLATDADLTRADLAGADLDIASLNAADFTRSALLFAHYNAARLNTVRFTDADLTGARWPRETAVPEGWKLDTGSGRLQPGPRRRLRPGPAGPDSQPAETN